MSEDKSVASKPALFVFLHVALVICSSLLNWVVAFMTSHKITQATGFCWSLKKICSSCYAPPLKIPLLSRGWTGLIYWLMYVYKYIYYIYINWNIYIYKEKERERESTSETLVFSCTWFLSQKFACISRFCTCCTYAVCLSLHLHWHPPCTRCFLLGVHRKFKGRPKTMDSILHITGETKRSFTYKACNLTYWNLLAAEPNLWKR